jgi:hypothetical protein
LLSNSSFISRYVTKKINGDQAFTYYSRTDKQTGEHISIEPEFSTQSLKPGIGASWYEKFKKDVYPSDQIIIDGKEFQVPAYYDKLLERENPELFERVKQKRLDNFQELNPDDFTYRRLIDKETCLQKNITMRHQRPLEK